MSEAGRPVARDEAVGRVADLTAGPGTYADGDVIKARFDGTLTIHDGACVVSRPRKPIARTRRRRGEGIATDETGPSGRAGIDREAVHRHGVGKHGRPGGKKKKGFGDQGAWD